MIYERVKYQLENIDTGRKLTLQTDPMNWDDSNRVIKRSEDTFGIFTELSSGLEFTEDGAEFLREAWLLKEIEASVILRRFVANPRTEVMTLRDVSVFDFSEYEEEEDKVKVPFKTGGLYALMESKFDDLFELERTTALNGVELEAFQRKAVRLTPREILLISELGSQTGDRMTTEYNVGFPQVFNDYATVPDLNVLSNSDEDHIANLVDGFASSNISSGVPPQPPANNFFYFDASQETELNVRVRYDLRGRKTGTSEVDYIFLVQKFNWNGSAFSFVEDIELLNQTDVAASEFIASEVSADIPLAIGDSLRFVIKCFHNTNPPNDNIAFLEINDLSVIATEESFRDPTDSEVYLYHDAGERLIQILTGDTLRFYSETFGREELPQYQQDGKWAYASIAMGLWIRQFYDYNCELSLKNYLKTAQQVFACGYSVEVIDNKETLVVEELKHFFQPSTAIVIPEQVSNVRRSAASEFYYANMRFGYKKPEKDNMYEEAQGLDEYNTQTNFVNPITRVDNEYNMISDMRADMYGKEFARRKLKLNFPNEDTRYDKDMFLFDLKMPDDGGEKLQERVWQDDFQVQPIGVFSPDTATNLRITPARNFQRHQWFVHSGLFKFSEDFVRYASSDANSNLETLAIGETDPIKEDQDFLIGDLEIPRFKNEWIEFDYPVDFDMFEQLQGTTKVGSREVPNLYFKVEFINELGNKEYGYIFELEPNNEGRWKLLKAK